jgi:hypothetical protein
VADVETPARCEAFGAASAHRAAKQIGESVEEQMQRVIDAVTTARGASKRRN